MTMTAAYQTRHPFRMAAAAGEGSVEDLPFKTPMSPPQPHLGHLSVHSAFPFSDPESDHVESDESLDGEDDDSHSASGYSPPAWRRLENGQRNKGFWDYEDDHFVGPSDNNHPLSPDDSAFLADNYILEQAIRTRLPTGSLSPEKGCTPEPDARAGEDETLVDHVKSERGSPLKRVISDDKTSPMVSKSPEAAGNNCEVPLPGLALFNNLC